MKKTVLMFTVILAFCTIQNAYAENFVWAPDYRTIAGVYPDSDFQFYLDGETIDTASSCANRFVIRHSDPNYNVKVATLLTAWERDRTIKVKYDADDTGCGTDIEVFKSH